MHTWIFFPIKWRIETSENCGSSAASKHCLEKQPNSFKTNLHCIETDLFVCLCAEDSGQKEVNQSTWSVVFTTSFTSIFVTSPRAKNEYNRWNRSQDESPQKTRKESMYQLKNVNHIICEKLHYELYERWNIY